MQDVVSNGNIFGHFDIILRIPGFMLLEEVKQFWSAVVSFYNELQKMIEYTLDSSCNALISMANMQRAVAAKRTKFVLKSKHREEVKVFA